jgi:hypothetical protein
MASIFNEMKQRALEIAEHLDAQISNFDKQLVDIEKQKAKIEADRQKARGALKRAADFPVKIGADYICPLCWVDESNPSIMRPVPSSDRHDIFRCNRCQFEASF